MSREKPVKVNVKAEPGHQEQMSPELQQRAHFWAVKPPRTKEWVLQSRRANHKPKTLAKSWRLEAEIRHLLFKTHRWQFVSRNSGGEERNARVAALSPQREACCIPGCWEPGGQGKAELVQELSGILGSSSTAYLSGCTLSLARMSRLALEVGK